MRRAVLLLIISIALSIFVPLSYGGWAALDDLAQAPLWLVGLIIGMIVVAWWVNGARVKLLADSAGAHMNLARGTVVTVATEFAGAATPAGAGALLTFIHLLRGQGLRGSRGAALYLANQSIDLLFFAVLAPAGVGYLLSLSETSLSSLGFALTSLPVILTVLVCWLLALSPRRFRRVMRRSYAWLPLSSPRCGALVRWSVHLYIGMRRVMDLSVLQLTLLLVLCVVHWLLRYGVLPVIAWTFGVHVSPIYLFLIQGALLFAGKLSMLPGGSGGVEIGFTLLLSPFAKPEEIALILILWRFATFQLYLIAGAPVFGFAAGGAALRLIRRPSSGKSERPLGVG